MSNFGSTVGVTVYSDDKDGSTRKKFVTLGKNSLRYVTGHVIGKPFSSVHGYVRKNRFYGTIYVKGLILFVEPILSKQTIKFTMSKEKKIKRSLNAYIYKVYQRPMYKNQVTSAKNWIKTSRANENHSLCFSCGLLLLSDFQFYRDVGESSIRKTVHSMLYHVKEANNMMRTQDFDNDKSPDCIGVHVSDIRIVTSENFRFRENSRPRTSHVGLTNYWKWNFRDGRNSLQQSEESPEEYLKDFSSLYLDGHCLGVLFSNKAFTSRVLGLAWKGDPRKDSGICQRRKPEVFFKNSDFSEELNLNALFVTLRTKSMERIPLRMGVLNLLHEILHSFGASHDHEGSDISSNRFLMSRYSNTDVHFNHSKLSTVSKNSVHQILSNEKMSSCLKLVENSNLCGDGIVQEGEECDCGSVEACLASRSCCIQPGGGPRRQQECTLSKPRQKFGKCDVTEAQP